MLEWIIDYDGDYYDLNEQLEFDNASMQLYLRLNVKPNTTYGYIILESRFKSLYQKHIVNIFEMTKGNMFVLFLSNSDDNTNITIYNYLLDQFHISVPIHSVKVDSMKIQNLDNLKNRIRSYIQSMSISICKPRNFIKN